MKNLSKIWVVPVVVLLFQACQKDITIVPLPYDQKLSIECLLMPGTLPKLYLSHSVPYFNLDVTPGTAFVPDGTVIIAGGGTAETLHVDSTYNYFFCRWEPFYIGDIPTQENVTYQLTVESGGKTYTAETTTNVPAAQIDSVTYVFAFNDIYGEHEGVVVDFTDMAGMDNYYRYQMTRDIDTSVTAVGASDHKSECLGDSSATVVEVGRFVYFDRNQDGLPIQFVIEPSYKHKEGTLGYVRLQTLDKSAADFFDNLDRQRKSNANPFIEPVFLQSNIPDAIGFFGSMNLSEPVPFVFPE